MGEDIKAIPNNTWGMENPCSWLMMSRDKEMWRPLFFSGPTTKFHAAASGEEAIEYLKRNKADILVLDMIMEPGLDGLETYKQILSFKPKQKAIIVSGFSETEQVEMAKLCGAGSYVKKPYLMEKVGIAIRDELNKNNVSGNIFQKK